MRMDYPITQSQCEYIRQQAKQKFDQIRHTFIDCGRWASPHRVKWLQSQTPGDRTNYHLVDATHVLAKRSYVAGFSEGNTSSTRPWFRSRTGDDARNMVPENHLWLDIFTRQNLKCLHNSNFYNAAPILYDDYGVFNTAAYYIEELKNRLHFHVLTPGSYFVINNAQGIPVVLVREMCLSVKALVDEYGVKKDGKWDWSNFSSQVRRMYEMGDYTSMVDVCQIVLENNFYSHSKPMAGLNRKWLSVTYECGFGNGPYYVNTTFGDGVPEDTRKENCFLRIKASKRKPFIIPKSDSNMAYEYGEKGPTTDALGLIKSLNKKAIAKDQALEKMLAPALQGPASLRKSYVNANTNRFVPLDAQSAAQGGLKTIHDINPAFGALVNDVEDMRRQVDKFYYSDYLLYLSMNPKTRTARETDAIVDEQKLVIGPNLMSLNWTHNVPLVEFVMDYVLDNDPHLPEIPQGLQGQFLRPEFVSVFAQAQKAADLPSVERYMQAMMNIAQFDKKIWDKVDVDKIADLFEDRLYLPAEINKAQARVDAWREQQMAMAERQMKIEQMALMAGASKDLGLQANKNGGQR